MRRTITESVNSGESIIEMMIGANANNISAKIVDNTKDIITNTLCLDISRDKNG